MSITRRGLVQGITVVSAGLAIPHTPALRAVLPSAQTRRLPFPGEQLLTAKLFDSGWHHSVAPNFPKLVELGGLVGGHVVEISWDSRVFSVTTPLQAVDRGGLVTELRVSRPSDGRLLATVDEAVAQLVIPVEAPDLYPNENLSDIRDTRVVIRDETGTLVADKTLKSARARANPWGVEVAVDWVSYAKDVVPARCRIMSVGPGAAPAGIELVAEYANVIGRPKVTPSSDSDRPRAVIEAASAAGVTRLVAQTTSPLAAGAEIEISFDPTASDSVPAPFTNRVPFARMEFGNTAAGGRRLSNVEESYPVTSSGGQLSSYLAADSAGSDTGRDQIE